MDTAVDARDEGAVAADGDDPLRQREARAYSRAGRRRGRVHQVVNAVLAVGAALAGARIARALDTPGPLPLDAAAYAWAAIAALWITGLPFALLGWRAARRAGLSRQRLPGWFGDQAKSIAIGAVIAPFVMWGLVAALRAWPHGWWVPVTLGSIALELLFTVITPVLIVPLFLRSHPLPPGPARGRSVRARGARRREGRIAARARGEREDVSLECVRGGYRPDAPDRALRQPAGRRPGHRAAGRRDALGARARVRASRPR